MGGGLVRIGFFLFIVSLFRVFKDSFGFLQGWLRFCFRLVQLVLVVV